MKDERQRKKTELMILREYKKNEEGNEGEGEETRQNERNERGGEEEREQGRKKGKKMERVK